MIGPICLAMPLLLGAAQDELKLYASKEGRFSVNMPGEPKVKTQDVGGDLTVTMAVAEGRHDSYFVVSYSDFRDKDLKKGECIIEILLNSWRCTYLNATY